MSSLRPVRRCGTHGLQVPAEVPNPLHPAPLGSLKHGRQRPALDTHGRMPANRGVVPPAEPQDALQMCEQHLNTHPVRCTTLYSGQLSEPKNARYSAQKLLSVPIAQTAGLGLPPRLSAGPPDLRLQPSTFLAGVLGRQSTYG